VTYYMFFFITTTRPAGSTFFPYTTLFRSIGIRKTKEYGKSEVEEKNSFIRALCVGWLWTGPLRLARPVLFPSTPSGVSNGISSRSEEHTSELQSRENLVCRLLLEKKKE